MELTPNSNLRAAARAALSGKWGAAVWATFICLLICTACSAVPFLNYITLLLVLPVLGFGITILFLNLMQYGETPKLDNLFDGFKQYGHTLGTMLLMWVYIILWSLLFYIPGIIKSYSYAMTPYILRDEPQLGADEVITRSMQMMRGHKMKLFLLDLSFIGWEILNILTLGIGSLWLIPYMQSSRAAFYLDLKRAQEAEAAAQEPQMQPTPQPGM